MMHVRPSVSLWVSAHLQPVTHMDQPTGMARGGSHLPSDLCCLSNLPPHVSCPERALELHCGCGRSLCSLATPSLYPAPQGQFFGGGREDQAGSTAFQTQWTGEQLSGQQGQVRPSLLPRYPQKNLGDLWVGRGGALGWPRVRPMLCLTEDSSLHPPPSSRTAVSSGEPKCGLGWGSVVQRTPSTGEVLGSILGTR